MLKSLLTVLLCVVAGSAVAADSVSHQAVRDAVHKLVPAASIESITKAPISDFYEVVASGQVVYVSADGKYLMQGKLFDLNQRKDLTATRMNAVRKAALAKVPAANKLVFAPEDPQYRVTVFTDIDCGYCRKLHAHMAAFNKKGIAFDYLFFPRTGLNTPSYEKAVSVWCSSNRKKAFTLAKLGDDPESARCNNPVASEFDLGQRLGVNGTPTIIASDGSVLGGYLTPAQLLQRLKQLAARRSSSDS